MKSLIALIIGLTVSMAAFSQNSQRREDLRPGELIKLNEPKTTSIAPETQNPAKTETAPVNHQGMVQSTSGIWVKVQAPQNNAAVRPVKHVAKPLSLDEQKPTAPAGTVLDKKQAEVPAKKQ